MVHGNCSVNSLRNGLGNGWENGDLDLHLHLLIYNKIWKSSRSIQNDVIKCCKMMSPHSNVCCDVRASLWTTYTREIFVDFFRCQLAGADPGFSIGGGVNPPVGGTNLQFCQHFPKNFMKLWKLWAVGGGDTCREHPP